MLHHDEATLVAFHDGELPAADADSVQRHLARCAECRARLDEVRRLKDEALELIAAVELPESAGAQVGATAAADLPAFRMASPRAAASMVAEPAPFPTGPVKRRRRWPTGLAWAATIVLAIGLGYSAANLRRRPAAVTAFHPESNPVAPPKSAAETPAPAEPPLAAGKAPAPAAEPPRTKVLAHAKPEAGARDDRPADRLEERSEERAKKDAPSEPAAPAMRQTKSRAAPTAAAQSSLANRVAEGSVKGAVVDAKGGRPVADATVVVEGTTTSGRTGVDGDFDLANVEGTNVRLRVMRLGYQPRTIDVAVGGPPVRVELSEASVHLDELVVTGTAAERKRAGLAKTETGTVPVTADSAIRTLGGSIKLIDGLVAEHYEQQGPLVRVVYRVPWGALVLEQRRMDTGLRFQLIAPTGAPADSVDAWRGRIK